MSIKKLASITNSDEGSPVPYEKVNTSNSNDIPELNDIEMIEVEDENVDEDPVALIDSD